MLENKLIKENLGKVYCHKCGGSLADAKISLISEASVALVAHAVCPVCSAQNMVTITPSGGGAVPVLSDLDGQEFKKFIDAKPIAYDELLDLHKQLKKTKIWNLLFKKEKRLVKKAKA
jgi:hypothetical protein